MFWSFGDSITFVGFYTQSGIGKEGLSNVSASIYKVPGGQVTTLQAIELGGGFYYINFTPTETGVYVCKFVTDDSSVDQQEIAAIAFVKKHDDDSVQSYYVRYLGLFS